MILLSSITLFFVHVADTEPAANADIDTDTAADADTGSGNHLDSYNGPGSKTMNQSIEGWNALHDDIKSFKEVILGEEED